jgi:hypothetical protein
MYDSDLKKKKKLSRNKNMPFEGFVRKGKKASGSFFFYLLALFWSFVQNSSTLSVGHAGLRCQSCSFSFMSKEFIF